MKCPKCGNEIKGFKEFCGKCGANIVELTSGKKSKNEENEGGVVPQEEALVKEDIEELELDELRGDDQPGSTAKDAKGEGVVPENLEGFKPVDYLRDDSFQDQGWDTWSVVSNRLYKHHEVRDEQGREIFKKYFDSWVKKIEPFHYSKILNQIKILSIIEHPSYQVNISSVTERRDRIEEFERPYNNERVYKKNNSKPSELSLIHI